RSTKTGLGCGVIGMGVVLPILAFLAIWQFLAPDPAPLTIVPFSDFIQLVNADPEREVHVETALIKGREITFVVKDPKSNALSRKRTIGPETTDTLGRELADHHIQVAFDKEDTAPEWPLVLPPIFLFVVAAAVAIYLRLQLAKAREDLSRSAAEVK